MAWFDLYEKHHKSGLDMLVWFRLNIILCGWFASGSKQMNHWTLWFILCWSYFETIFRPKLEHLDEDSAAVCCNVDSGNMRHVIYWTKDDDSDNGSHALIGPWKTYDISRYICITIIAAETVQMPETVCKTTCWSCIIITMVVKELDRISIYGPSSWV